MPVNYEQLRSQIYQMGEKVSSRAIEEKKQMVRFSSWFEEAAAEANLSERLGLLLSENPNARSAFPLEENIGDSFAEGKPIQEKLRIFACDGSQVIPNRHDEISFALLNTAVFEYVMNSGETPRIDTMTELLDPDEDSGGDRMGVMRDEAEKRRLADASENAEPDIPAIAICDGPVELFMDRSDIKGLETLKANYRESLGRITAAGVPIIGYIDRPQSNPVLTMLQLLNSSEPCILPDSALFEKRLAPGERSAVFGMNSRFNRELRDELQLCFFYLNVGTASAPCISRVEFPAWVARDPEQLERVHSALLAQCRILRGLPYPYVLHRAHECAVVTFTEKDDIKNLLMDEMLRRGLTPAAKSNKQTAKDLSGSAG